MIRKAVLKAQIRWCRAIIDHAPWSIAQKAIPYFIVLIYRLEDLRT